MREILFKAKRTDGKGWVEGLNADANPYNKIHQNTEWWCWHGQWKQMNIWC